MHTESHAFRRKRAVASAYRTIIADESGAMKTVFANAETAKHEWESVDASGKILRPR